MYTRIIPSPGVPSSHAIYHSGKIVSELDFLLPYVPKDFQIHAVTGTDGKSTTSWLLYQFLRGGFPEDVPVYIGGNFGTPFADVLSEIREKKEKSGHIVLEVSSFMAYRLSTFRIDNTILTNLHPDHLDWHSDVHEYYQSKFTLLGRTRSLILYPESIVRDLPEISDIPLQRIVLPEHVSLENNLLPLSDEVFLDISDSQLYGAHNLANIFFAAQLAFHLGISAKQLSTILAHVPPLSHRLQKISEKSGRIWIDDSKSTTAQSLFAALRSFSPQKVYLIAGGKNKGDTFE